jgi:hypothetical protein
MIKIERTVGEPVIATDSPAIRVQQYDAKKVRRQLHDLLRARGFEFRSARQETQGHEMEVFWVKRDEAAG